MASSDSTRKIAPFAWRVVEPAERDVLPEFPACYVVLVGGRPFYIGQTKNLRDRFRAYRFDYSYGGASERITPWGCLSDVVLKVKLGRKYGDWLMREARLIRRLQPLMNCTGSVKPRASRRTTH